MKLVKRILALLLASLPVIGGCAAPSIPTNVNTAFRNYTLCLFQEEVSANTINLHYSLETPEKYGITEIPITLGSYDLDEASALAAIENLNSSLHQFSYRALSEENKLTYDILDHYFSILEKDISFYLYSEPLSPITGIHAQLPILLAEYPFRDEKDPEIYLSLLKTVPDYFASLCRFEESKAAAGLFMSDVVADEILAQCDAFLTMDDNHYLITTFTERLQELTTLTQTEQEALIKQNQDILKQYVLPAYSSLEIVVSRLKGVSKDSPNLCNLPNGREYYAHLIAKETGSSRSVSELKELIETQILLDLLDSQNVLGKNPSLLEETSSSYSSCEDILQSLKHQITDAFPDISAVDVKVKYVPEALEEHLSPAFYLIPSIDNVSQNTIYMNPAYSLADINLFTTLAHEGYPGHLYQTVYFSQTDPDPIRTLLDFTGYTEGWATYGGTALCYTDCCSEYKSNKFSNSSENLYLITILLSS